jgi:hypothetical protein
LHKKTTLQEAQDDGNENTESEIQTSNLRTPGVRDTCIVVPKAPNAQERPLVHGISEPAMENLHFHREFV